jgi:peroxin-5
LLSKTAGELLQNVSRDLETNDKMRNSSFMRLMQKLRDKEVTVQGDQMVEGGEAQQQQIDPSLTHGGVHVGDVDVQRELQQEALGAQQPLLAGGGRGEAVCARPQGMAGNPMAGTAGATFASGNWQQRQEVQQPDAQAAQTEGRDMDELAAAYEEMNSVLDDDMQSRAQRAFQGDGGRMDTSVPGASAAWEEDFDDFDFDNALLRSGPEPPTMAQSLRENVQQQEWGHLQSQWDSLVTDAAGIQLQQPTGATAASSSAALANYPFHSRNPYMLNAQHRHHLPSDTILAREAAVQESPSNPLAWLSLGLKQQENEREELAIRALQRALELDPTLGEAWLALAVSYTNDNVRGKAYDAIERWVESKGEYESVIEHHRERAGGASAREAGQVLNSQRHAYLTGLLVDMARAGGGESGVDADVQIALGVLFNASEEYEKASDCFMAALSVRPNVNTMGSEDHQAGPAMLTCHHFFLNAQDPHLFNRLGATMANSGKAESALDYYYRALELQPDFARAT